MLFNSSQVKGMDESYKERNLYYKIFAGYIFNELIPGSSERTKHLFSLIAKKCNEFYEQINVDHASRINAISTIEAIQDQELHVDFDHHLCQIDQMETKNDRGEFADILINSKTGLIAFEVKFLSNWNIGKDIKQNRERIAKVLNKTNCCWAIQVLLVSDSKLKIVKGKNGDGKKGSQYAQLFDVSNRRIFSDLPQIGFAIITWEEILSEVIGQGDAEGSAEQKTKANEIVSAYLLGQLKGINPSG